MRAQWASLYPLQMSSRVVRGEGLVREVGSMLKISMTSQEYSSARPAQLGTLFAFAPSSPANQAQFKSSFHPHTL